jgi:hypothetical protein
MKNLKSALWTGVLMVLTLTACQPAPTSGVVSGKICFPSDTIPEMTLFFQSTNTERTISYQAHEGQNSYSLELEPGTYHAYSWLPEGMLIGGMYSTAVPCGLEASCTDHSLLPVEVKAGKETSGVDICDWYADPGTAPLPPGRVEGLIADFWQEQFDEQIAAEVISTEEISTMQGELAKQLGGRLFRVSEGLLEKETFLITHSSEVIRLGRTAGGRGVTSLALADLDRDDRAELYFTYSFEDGGYQSRLAVYIPEYDLVNFEADLSFQGDLMLFSEQPHQVGIRAVEGDLETKTIQYQETLGYLTLQVENGQPVLGIDLIDGLPREVLERIAGDGS